MDFLDKRIGVICNELKKLKVKQIFPLTQWEYKEGNFVHPEDALNDAAAWENFDCKTMHWYSNEPALLVPHGLYCSTRAGWQEYVDPHFLTD